MNNFWEKPDFLAVSGSHLYGTNIASSDKDERGFVVEPAEYLLGRKTFDQKVDEKPIDRTVYGFRRVLKHFELGNPNVSEMLFTPKDKILVCTKVGQLVLNNANLFVSKSMIAKMLAFSKQCSINFNKEKEGWTKDAYHAFRLLRQVEQLLDAGRITYPLDNTKFLLAVRGGSFLSDKLNELYEQQKLSLEAKLLSSSLPEHPNLSKIDELYYQVILPIVGDFAAMKVGL